LPASSYTRAIVRVQVFERMAAIPQAAWDGLRDAGANPFMRWHWLEALESSGCATPENGWAPCHLTLWRGSDLIAAAPSYVKEDSDGDFSRDWGWADAAIRASIPYYPKLVIAVPFTPVSGRRILVAPGEDRAICVAAIVSAAHELATRLGASSVHVLFPTQDEARELEAVGLARRVAFQYHWRNHGYADPTSFLACFSAKKRHQARRERGAPAEQEIQIRTVRGEELAHDRLGWARSAFDLHRSTVDKLRWGRRWLNRGFYERVFGTMPEDLEVVAAIREGRLIAGAFNVATPTHLYGRYWGCFEEHPFLHFNVCLYHSIDECIRRGLQVFEGGAGGEHKIARGFEPAETYSAHAFSDARLDRPIRRYIEEEAREREAALARWQEASPILRRRPLVKQENP
jgi:predicted N-acyltransferase